MYKPRHPSFSYVLQCCSQSETCGFIELTVISSKCTKHIFTGNKEIGPNNNWMHEQCRETFVSSCSKFFVHFANIHATFCALSKQACHETQTLPNVGTAGVTRTQVFWSWWVRATFPSSVTVLCKQILFYINTFRIKYKGPSFVDAVTMTSGYWQ